MINVFYLGCGAIKARTKSIEVVMERYLPLIHVPLIERYTKRTISSVYYTRRHVLFWGIGNSFRSGKVDQKGPCAFLLLIGVMTKIYLTLPIPEAFCCFKYSVHCIANGPVVRIRVGIKCSICDCLEK